MSLDNIILPAVVLEVLYEKNLYDIQEGVGAGAATPAPKIPARAGEASPAAPAYLGGNKKRVLIMVQDADAVHIEAGRLDVLTKILAACKLTLEDVAIYNTTAQQAEWTAIQQVLQPRYCLLFNVSPDAIGLPVVFPFYHQHQHNGCGFLLSNGLDEISSNTLLKSKLWLCLKEIFQV